VGLDDLKRKAHRMVLTMKGMNRDGDLTQLRQTVLDKRTRGARSGSRAVLGEGRKRHERKLGDGRCQGPFKAGWH
jgi:hypothetical protein